MIELQRVEASSLCLTCRGRCCELSPGRFAPEDIEVRGGMDMPTIIGMLEAGATSITCGLVSFMGSALAPIFMLAVKGDKRPELDFFRDTVRCILLEPGGCSLNLQRRPLECAAIIPSTVECCLPKDSNMEDFWVDHQVVMRKIIEQQTQKKWFDAFKTQLYDRRRNDSYIQNVRNLAVKHGLASGEAEIFMISDMARNTPF